MADWEYLVTSYFESMKVEEVYGRNDDIEEARCRETRRIRKNMDDFLAALPQDKAECYRDDLRRRAAPPPPDPKKATVDVYRLLDFLEPVYRRLCALPPKIRKQTATLLEAHIDSLVRFGVGGSDELAICRILACAEVRAPRHAVTSPVVCSRCHSLWIHNGSPMAQCRPCRSGAGSRVDPEEAQRRLDEWLAVQKLRRA